MKSSGESGAVFCTPRLIVRTWEPETDAEDAFAMYGDPEVVRYLGANPQTVPNLEAMRARLADRTRALASYDRTGFWAAQLRETGQVVGALLFKDTPDADGHPTGDLEIGWHFRQSAWGHGYASEGGRALIEYAFQRRPDVRRLIAIAYPENVRSLKVMERIGMNPVGLTSRYYGVHAMLYEVIRP